jgi:exopolyphosphatase/pppGpp-phosphohydrolase
MVLGSGGTFVTLCGVHHGIETSEIEARPGLALGFDELKGTVDRLLQMTVAEIAELPAVAPARAAVLQAGAICAERAVAHIGSGQVGISISDILDGVALQLGEP